MTSKVPADSLTPTSPLITPIHTDSQRQVEPLSIKQRMAMGKALRQTVKRSQHALYQSSDHRDPIAILEAQAKTRVPELVPIRYARMLASPFAFLRGSAAVMIEDIAPAPLTGINVQAGGDMHIANFGAFASAERNLVFGINDFDETYPAPWEWDVKRLAASIVVAGRYLGGDRVLCETAVRAAVQSYRQHLQDYAQMNYLDLWYDSITEVELLEKLPTDLRRRTVQLLGKARQRNHLQVLEKMTDLVDDQHQIIETPPLIVRAATLGNRAMPEALDLLMQDYFASLSAERRFLLSHYRILDVARKVVGVGSVGTRCWVVYLEGKGPQDPLFLQIKEAQPSVLAAHSEARCGYRLPDHQGHRVVVGQRLIQGAPDIFLGWGELDGIHYYIRQLRDMKGSVKLEPDQFRPSSLPDYCSICGWALALAHAKSTDAAILAGYVGRSPGLDNALVKFAQAYADQTEQDYDSLVAATRQGRIQVAEATD